MFKTREYGYNHFSLQQFKFSDSKSAALCFAGSNPALDHSVQVSKRSKEVTTKKEKETRLFSRAVKGVTLKMSCFGFVGSNPTAAI